MSLVQSVKEVTKDMSIYGVSTLLGQVISFFLLPLYTSYLTPEDYGILSLIGIFTGGYGVLSSFGISSAIFRFTGMAKSEVQKLEYLDTAQYNNIFLNLFFGSIALLFSVTLAAWLFDSPGYDSFLRFAILLGFIGSLASIPLSYLRIRRMTVKIAYSSLINLIITVVCTITGLVVLEWGIWGALIGNACGNIASLLFLLSNVNRPKWSNFSFSKTKALMNYALPMLPHKTFGFLLPIFSQVLLIRYLSLEGLGLYNIAYKLCTPLAVFIQLFQKSYSPYRFEILNQKKNSKELFKKINLFFVLIISIGYSLIVIFGDDIIRFLTEEKFHKAGNYLLFIALIPVAQSLYFLFGTGIEFSKSPKYLPLISGTGFGVTLISCFLLIPDLGINGAALAPTFGWLTMAILIYLYAQNLFKIPYTWKGYLWIFLLTFVFQVYNTTVKNTSLTGDILLFSAYLCILSIFFRRSLFSFLKNQFIHTNRT